MHRWGVGAVALVGVALVALGAWRWVPSQVWPAWLGGATSETEVVVEAVPEVPSAPLPIYGPPVPMQWAYTGVPWRFTTFTPPPGYWVYFSQWNREFLVIPGKPLPDGSPAPDETALYASAVAVMSEVFFDQTSFTDWEQMELTMAEFSCARGATEEVYELCVREPSGIRTGINPSGLPFRSFSLPKIQYLTKERIGVAPFTVVRLGETGTFGLLIYAIDAVRGPAAARALVQSMVRDPEALPSL